MIGNGVFLLNPYAFVQGLARGAGAIYGLRQILTSYKGYCLRLSDSAGNTTDIGFVDGELDGNAAQAAMDAGQTRVTIWYDQTTLANHIHEVRWDYMPTLVRDVLPSHAPVLRFYNSTLSSVNSTLNDIWTRGGYLALGIRYNSGTGLGKFIVNYTVDDALFTYAVPVGSTSFIALAITYNSTTPQVKPTIEIDGSAITVNAVQWGGGTVSPQQTPFVLGGVGFDGDIWEAYVYKEIP